MRRTIIFCIAIILFGCNNSPYKNEATLNAKQVFGVTDTLHGVLLPEVMQVKAEHSDLFYTSYGLVCESNMEGKVVQLLDSLTGAVISYSGVFGRGPNEMLSCLFQDYDSHSNILYTFDLDLNRLDRFHISADTIVRLPPFDIPIDVYNLCPLSDTTFAIMNFYPTQVVGTIRSNGDYINKLFYRPVEDGEFDYTRFYFSATMGLSYDKKVLVAFSRHFTILSLYTFENEKIILKSMKPLFPLYSFVGRGYRPKIHDKQLIAGGKMRCSSKHFFVSTQAFTHKEEMLADDKSRPKQYTYILKFDFEGNYIKTYVLDKFFYCYAVSPDGKSLYASVDDPDFYLCKYTLD